MLFSAFSYLLLFYAHCYMHELFPLHTHSPWSRSDDPGFARPDIGRLFLMCRCSMRRYALRGAWVLSLWFWYTCILFLLSFFDSCISPLTSIQLSFSSCYSLLSCAVLYVLLQWSLIIKVLIHSLFRLQFRLSVYTWGIFLAYMRRHNVSISLGLGRYKIP